MNKIEVGQVLWLKLKFQADGEYSKTVHPYLVVNINDNGTANFVNLLQFDSLEGKEWRIQSNKYMVIMNTDPKEDVIFKDSFLRLDSIFLVENFEELKEFKRNEAKLSKNKLERVLFKYNNFVAEGNHIPDSRQIMYKKADILDHNQFDNN